MKKKKKVGLVDKFKRLIKELELIDRKSDGKLSSMIIVILSILTIALIILYLYLIKSWINLVN